MANGPALLAGSRFVFHECDAIAWQDLPLTRAVRSWLEGLAEPKGGRPEEWFALDADVPSASLPLEIKDEIGAWREIAHDDLKRQHEDFVGVTQAVDGRPIIHHAPPTLSYARNRTEHSGKRALFHDRPKLIGQVGLATVIGSGLPSPKYIPACAIENAKSSCSARPRAMLGSTKHPEHVRCADLSLLHDFG